MPVIDPNATPHPYRMRLDSQEYTANGFRPKAVTVPVVAGPNEFLQSMSLWTPVDAVWQPLLTFPFTLDGEFFIRTKPDASGNCQCACCSARDSCVDCCR